MIIIYGVVVRIKFIHLHILENCLVYSKPLKKKVKNQLIKQILHYLFYSWYGDSLVLLLGLSYRHLSVLRNCFRNHYAFGIYTNDKNVFGEKS